MSNRNARILPNLLLVFSMVSITFAADTTVSGSWVGVSERFGIVYRLHLEEGGGGTLAYVSRTGGEPTVRSYTVRDWKLESRRFTLDLEEGGKPSRLKLSGKLSGRNLTLKVSHGRATSPEPLLMTREDRFLDDYKLMKAATTETD